MVPYTLHPPNTNHDTYKNKLYKV